jgi:hypothetical protein
MALLLLLITFSALVDHWWLQRLAAHYVLQEPIAWH